MSSGLNLSAAVAVFPSPNCNETINTSMQQCPFCLTPIDPTAAEGSAAFTSKISQASNDASYLKIMLGMLLPFGGLMFLPFVTLAGLIGFTFIKYAATV